MVLIASASDHRHRRAAKPSPPANPATPLPSKVPAAPGLNGFSFSWGAQRRLRCSKDGAPVFASPSPPQNPHTPSPDKEEKNPKPPSPPGCSSSRPQRPRNLRPLRYAASRPEGAGHHSTPLQSPKPAAPRKRGFAVALTPEEIAHDFAAILGCCATTTTTTRARPATPARRTSKKRQKHEHKAIDKACPGLMLLDVDLDNYKIEERGQQR